MNGKKQTINNTKRLIILAVMVSQALVLSIVESWIPVPTVVPGVKLGLANIISLVVLILFGLRDAISVVTVRCVLSSIYGGGFTVFLFSIAGGILSILVMGFLYRRMSKIFGIIGISVSGAVMHNVAQISMAALIMKELAVYSYLPVLLISGIIMGLFTGICSNYLLIALKKINFLY